MVEAQQSTFAERCSVKWPRGQWALDSASKANLLAAIFEAKFILPNSVPPVPQVSDYVALLSFLPGRARDYKNWWMRLQPVPTQSLEKSAKHVLRSWLCHSLSCAAWLCSSVVGLMFGDCIGCVLYPKRAQSTTLQITGACI